MKKIQVSFFLSFLLSLLSVQADHTAQGISREVSTLFTQFGKAAGTDLLLLAEYAEQVQELEHLEAAVEGLTQAYQGKLAGFVAVTGEPTYVSGQVARPYQLSALLMKSHQIPVGQAQLEVLNSEVWALVTKVGSPDEGECVLGVIFSPQALVKNSIVMDENSACRLVFGGAGPGKVWTLDLGSEQSAQMLASVPEETGPYIDEQSFDIYHAQSLRETLQFLNWDFELSVALVQTYRERIPGQLTGRWMGACSLNDGLDDEAVAGQTPRGRTMEAVILQQDQKMEIKIRFENRVSGFLGTRKGMDITAWPDGLVEGEQTGFCKATYMPAKKALKGEVYRNSRNQTEKLSFYLLPAVQ